MTTDQAGCKQTAWLKEVVLFLLSFFFNNASTTALTVTKDAQIHHAGSTRSQPYILGAYIFPPDASQMFCQTKWMVSSKTLLNRLLKLQNPY